MKQFRNAKIFTLIFHGFIIIIAGHGVGIMGMLDGLFPYYLLKGEVHFESFENLIPWIVFSSFFGKIMIIFSLFSIRSLWKSWLTVIGVLLLLFSYIATVITSEESVTILSLLSGIPFLLFVGRVFYVMFCFKKTG